MSDDYARFNDECTHMFYWDHYLHHGVWQITRADLLMNVHTCVTDKTAYTMLYVRPLCLINDECTHTCNW